MSQPQHKHSPTVLVGAGSEPLFQCSVCHLPLDITPEEWQAYWKARLKALTEVQPT